MACFICNIPCEVKNKKDSISLLNGITEKTNYKYTDMLNGIVENVEQLMECIEQANDSDIICVTCKHLIDVYDRLYYEAKVCQELLMRQLYRTFNISKLSQKPLITDLIDYDVKAASSDLYRKIPQTNMYNCKQCNYKTKYSDTLAAHYKFHKFKSQNKIHRNSVHQENVMEIQQFTDDDYDYDEAFVQANINLNENSDADNNEYSSGNPITENDLSTTGNHFYGIEFLDVNNYNKQDQVARIKRRFMNVTVVDDLNFLNESVPIHQAYTRFKRKHHYCCEYCNYTAITDSDYMKKHILQTHPNKLKLCALCGEKTLQEPCDHQLKIASRLG